MADDSAPYHAHIYFSDAQRPAAVALRDALNAQSGASGPILFVGQMTEGKAGPHPIPQYEVHFLERALAEISAILEASGLRVLVHPLTDDDLADHTSLGTWIGDPVTLDLTTLDPPGHNQGIPRFGKSDF